MGEVDSIFTIKHLHQHIEIARPFLRLLNIDNPAALLASLKNHGGLRRNAHSNEISLESILQTAFQNAEDSRKVGMMKKYRLYEEARLEEISSPERLERAFSGRIPLFINGLCVTDYSRGIKYGVDPYSNSHLFSTLFLESAGEIFPREFLDLFRLIYIQPVIYTQQLITGEIKELGLEDTLRHRVETEINPALSGIGFGELYKSKDPSPKKGNSRYHPALFSLKPFKKILETAPELLREAATYDGKLDFDHFLESKRYETHLNIQLLAKRFAHLIDSILPQIHPALKEYGLTGLPLYMEKTSDSARVMDAARTYAENPIRFQFVGGESGILASTPELMPTLGICHPSAMGRLLGLMENIHQQWSKQFIRRPFTQKLTKQKVDVICYHSQEDFPFLLLEEGTEERHPNLQDLAKEMLSPEELKYVQEFSYAHRVGFARIEPRLVTLLTSNPSIYHGLRSSDKTNSCWQEELARKTVLTADQIPGFLALPSICLGNELPKSNFRGSEFSLPTTPKMDKRWHALYEEGRVIVGCTLEKLISGMNREQRMAILQEQLSEEPPEIQEEFRATHNQKLESIFALRGTAIHKISSAPKEGLVHYETLSKAGLEPKSPESYTETPFYHRLNLEGREITVSLHPDAYLFLQRGKQDYDLIILDTKTNRVTPYPEHKYLQQTFFYGWIIKQMMEESLGFKVHNIYTVLNKNAFYRGFYGKNEAPLPHATYREQKLSPITKFSEEDFLHQAIHKILARIMEEKESLRNYATPLDEYFKKKEKDEACEKCYLEHRLVCKRLIAQYQNGINVSAFLL